MALSSYQFLRWEEAQLISAKLDGFVKLPVSEMGGGAVDQC